MTAPKRWLDETGTGLKAERDLLRLGVTLEPPPGSNEAVWASLAGQLPPGAGGGSSASGSGGGATATKAAGAAKATAAAATGGGILKSALLGAGAAAIAVGAYGVLAPPTLPANEPRPVVIAAATAAPREVAPSQPAPREASPEPSAAPSAAAETRVEARRATPVAASAVAAEAAATERATALREESRLLSEAREALRRGDVSNAGKKLDESFARFPSGMLGQEREALTIETLHKSGRQGAAKARAAAFLRTFPNSAHAPRIQAFAN